jgi:predicted acylesterase/phospholipase RssA
VYTALAPWFRARGHRLALVCGTSIGAINASIIAARYGDPDQGTGALSSFWHSLEQASFPFAPPVGHLASVNAIWTSLLFGNPRMFQPTVPFWSLMPPVTWAPFTAFYDTAPMERSLAGFFCALGSRYAAPRLVVTAINLGTERPVAFDSWDTAITPRHIVASCSLPPTFPPTALNGTTYWDGGLWSNTPLREALNALQKPGSPRPPAMDDCLVFVVELFAAPTKEVGALAGNWDVWARRDRITYRDKSDYDKTAARNINNHIDFVRRARKLLQALPPEQRLAVAELADYVEEEYASLQSKGRLRLTVHRILRSPDPAGDVSREIDFSPARINALIEHGRSDAERTLRML